jgi:hypothetical protein
MFASGVESESGHAAMCQSCLDIDKKIDDLRRLLDLTPDVKEVERLTRQIMELYGDRVRLHRNEEK